MKKHTIFDRYINQYEQWFDENNFVYQSELEAIRQLCPLQGRGVEIGIGSGLFALPLGIKEGCDPSSKMRAKAVERGLNAIDGKAEDLPYSTGSFNFALMLTTICFVDDAQQSIREVKRILKHQGEFIVAFVDKNSPIGQGYFKHKNKSVFYKDATFYSTPDIYTLLGDNDFKIIKTQQTIFGELNEVKQVQKVENSYGKGSFVVIKAEKK